MLIEKGGVGIINLLTFSYQVQPTSMLATYNTLSQLLVRPEHNTHSEHPEGTYSRSLSAYRIGKVTQQSATSA